MNMMKNEKAYSDLIPFTIWVLAPHIETIPTSAIIMIFLKA